jgi:hypothetical protein
LREQLFRLLCYGARFIPKNIGKEIFSERVISGQIRQTTPAIVGLMKVAEDKRSWDWYEPF